MRLDITGLGLEPVCRYPILCGVSGWHYGSVIEGTVSCSALCLHHVFSTVWCMSLPLLLLGGFESWVQMNALLFGVTASCCCVCWLSLSDHYWPLSMSPLKSSRSSSPHQNKLLTMYEIYKLNIRSAIGKPQVLCVTREQKQNNPSKLEYQARLLM